MPSPCTLTMTSGGCSGAGAVYPPRPAIHSSNIAMPMTKTVDLNETLPLVSYERHRSVSFPRYGGGPCAPSNKFSVSTAFSLVLEWPGRLAVPPPPLRHSVVPHPGSPWGFGHSAASESLGNGDPDWLKQTLFRWNAWVIHESNLAVQCAAGPRSIDQSSCQRGKKESTDWPNVRKTVFIGYNYM